MENSKSNIWTSLLPLEEDFLSRPFSSLSLSLSPVWRTEITCVYEAIVATISVDLNSPSTRLFLGSYNSLLHSHRNLIPAPPPSNSNCFAGYDIKSKCCQVSGYRLSLTIRLSKIAFVVRIIRQMDRVNKEVKKFLEIKKIVLQISIHFIRYMYFSYHCSKQVGRKSNDFDLLELMNSSDCYKSINNLIYYYYY